MSAYPRLKEGVAYETLWPASADMTGALLRCIVFIADGMNCPTESGPNNTGSFADISRLSVIVIVELTINSSGCYHSALIVSFVGGVRKTYNDGTNEWN